MTSKLASGERGGKKPQGQLEGKISSLALVLRQLKAGWRMLLLLTAFASLSSWPLTRAFAQATAESSAVSLEDTDRAQNDDTDDTIDGQCAGADDQAAQSGAAGQSSAGQSSQGSAPSQKSGGTANQSSTEGRRPRPLNVNPVTGMVSASEANYEPLTGTERVKIYFKMNYASMGAYFGPFFTALVLDQATGSPAQWGGGFAGYGRRVASRLGTAILQGTFQAPTAALLHEDVRYIASSQHGIKKRAWHAVKYSFLTYNQHGQPTLNVANLSSYYAATAISVAWLPSHNNVATYTLTNATEQVGLSIPLNLLQEFWPEVRHAVLRR